jgi:hypothetical protein
MASRSKVPILNTNELKFVDQIKIAKHGSEVNVWGIGSKDRASSIITCDGPLFEEPFRSLSDALRATADLLKKHGR